jgi:SET domain-containing protein
MKPSSTKKLLLTAATAATILAPMIPKTVNFNITMEAKQEKPYTVITTQCRLDESFLDEKGHQVCSYKCGDGDNRIIHKVMYGSGTVCRGTVEEQVKKTKK